ncbi:MAG: selenocysteine-specific translation elongation factor, partial [Candidatus Cloacimonetes bacterium]|nr:selenocysteine-specific translation elongation factor [Candidatus Cloacimonadota bacterium]
MTAKHLIMGTAGHVDHGKTSLIKALTGFDCDTHKQEKLRGITINLGFTHLDLPNGDSVGIIDVPGHADFIKTMVSGAAGIDFVLLTIAADEGVMPQTREHLEIMQILGIQSGLIALTKADLVDEELLELAREEVREFGQDSFLANAPIIPVSVLDKRGLNELLTSISSLITDIPMKEDQGIFRLYIDRIFSQPGFGTVVNGSVLSGRISREQPVYITPGNTELKIRKIERHGTPVDSVQAGDRASLNLSNLRIRDFRRGMMLCSQPLEATTLLDARIRLFRTGITIGRWSQAVLLLGTIRQMVRIHLLDADELTEGQSGLVQIYLPQPAVLQFGDKFILRNSSGDRTLGGGEVLDPYPLHHRRRRESQIEIVRKKASGELPELIAAEVKKSPLPVSYRKVASNLNQSPDELIPEIFRNLPGEIVFFQTADDLLLQEKKHSTALQNKILNSIRAYHQKNPLLATGRTFNELLGIFGTQQNENTRLTLNIMLQKLLDEGKIRNFQQTWVLAEHQVTMDEETSMILREAEEFLCSSRELFHDLKELQEKFTGSAAGD